MKAKKAKRIVEKLQAREITNGHKMALLEDRIEQLEQQIAEIRGRIMPPAVYVPSYAPNWTGTDIPYEITISSSVI